MRPAGRLIRIFLCLAAMCLLMAGLACQRPARTADQGQATATSASLSASKPSADAVHDLSQDEAAGGHTLKKHVGRSDDQLRGRLRQERNISAASTYTDRATAEMVVGAVLQAQQAKIRRWLDRESGHPNLVLDYAGDSTHPIGRTMRRGEDQSQPCSHAVVVLRWSGPNDYYVLTTYPECQP